MIKSSKLIMVSAIIATAVSGGCTFFSTPDGETAQNQMQRTKKNVRKEVAFVPLSQVQLTAGPLYQRQKLNNNYIVYTIHPDRMLAPFMLRAGQQPKEPRYDGWEDGQLSGHAMGHYLSALAYVYDISKDEALRAEAKKKADYIVGELAKLQETDADGYTMPMPKETFTRLKNNDVQAQPFNLNGIWSPFYTYHKVLAGLRDVYRLMGNKQALKVEKGLSDFVINCVTPLTEGNIQKMLSCEFGGMQEVLADLTVDTKDSKYLEAANKFFYHKALMDPLEAARDHLTGRHGNTMIPEITGMGRIYEITGDPKFRKITEFFYDRVANYRSYATGGNGEGEYFFAIGDEPKHLTSHTTESCNCYNMLKVAKLVYEWNPKAEIMDYVERVTLNHIVSVCGAEQAGEYGYFQPLASVAVKDFSRSEHVWTCCVGTGLENPARYGEQIIAVKDNSLFLNQFWDSKIELPDFKTNLEVSGGFPYADSVTLKFELKKSKSFELNIRKPYWSENINLQVNGKTASPKLSKNGYVTLERSWENNDTVTVHFDFKLRSVPMNKDSNTPVCIMYGPFVMAGIVPETNANRKMRQNLRENRSYETEPAFVTMNEADIVKKLEPTGKFAHFRSKGLISPEDLEFVPLMEIYRQFYAVYFKKQTDKAASDEELAKRTIDQIKPGFQQSEIDHKGVYNNSQVFTNNVDGSKARYAPAGEWFSYVMDKVPVNKKSILYIRFFGRNSHLNVTINDKTYINEDIDAIEPVTRTIPVTAEMLNIEGKMKIMIQGDNAKRSPNIQAIILCDEK